MAYKKISGIYKITNTVNGKVYVGSAANIKQRFNTHKNRLIKQNHHSVKLQRAWDKYGAESFSFDIIEECEEAVLLEREQHWIDHYKSAIGRNGYNVCAVAGRTTGFKVSEETKRKHSEREKGKKKTPEHVAAVSASLKGHEVSDETRKKIGDKAREKWKDPEYRAMMVEKLKNRPKPSDATKEKHSQRVKKLWEDQEYRQKMVERASGFRHTEESKAKIAESNRTRVYSEETLKKMSETQKRKAAERGDISEETRAKLAEASRNRVWTPESLKRLSEGVIRGKAEKKRRMLEEAGQTILV